MADRLETRLADLGDTIAWPPAVDLAPGITARIRARPVDRTTAWWPLRRGRPVHRGLLVAVALLLLLAATVAAVGIALPGLRLVFVPPAATLAPTTPPAAPSGAALGGDLGLGAATTLDDAAARVGFDPLLPAGVGDPAAVFVDGDRLSLVWREGERLPGIEATGVGLLLTELRGTVGAGYYEKQLHEGATTVEPVDLGGRTAYWLTGEPHGLVYVGPDGEYHDEARRLVGDVLIWERGDLTLRLESGLGRDATIELAESLRPTD